jgi:hypothetical protein
MRVQRRRPLRGQTIVLFALTFLALSMMIFMTLAVTARLRRKMELQTVTDTAAYANAIVTARAYNAMSVVNRASLSHWVVLSSIQAELAYGTMVPAILDAYAAGFTRLLEFPQVRDASGNLLTTKKLNNSDICALTEAADVFYHAEHALWSTSAGVGDKDLTHLNNANHTQYLTKALGRAPAPCSGPFYTKLTHATGAKAFDVLDQKVGVEATQVRKAIQDLTQVQQGLYCQLLTALGATGVPAENIPGAGCPAVPDLSNVIAGQAGKASPYPMTPATFSNPGPHPPYLPSYVPPAAADALASIAMDRNDALQLLHTSLASRGRHFPVGGEQDWDDGNPTANYYRSAIPPKLMQQVDDITTNFLNAKYAGRFYTKNWPLFLLMGLFDNGNDATTTSSGAPITVDTGDGGQAQINASVGVVLNNENRTGPNQIVDAVSVRASIIDQNAVRLCYTYSTPTTGSNRTCYFVPIEVTVRDYPDLSKLEVTSVDPHMTIHEWKACDNSADCGPGSGLVPASACSGSFTGDRGPWACWLYGKQGEGVPNYGLFPWYKFFYGDEGDPAFLSAHVFGDEAIKSNHFLGAMVPEAGVATNPLDGFGILPGGFSFVFPQTRASSPLPMAGAHGAFGQPKSPVLFTRPNKSTGALDPWDFNFTFNSGAVHQKLDFTDSANSHPQLALGTGITYYHRRREHHDPLSWMETGSLVNPFWHATLVPIDVDESPTDPTPGLLPYPTDPAGAIKTLGGVSGASSAAALDAANVYQGLKAAGYRGIQ